MADFWGGVGKGFAHGFEKSYDSAARRRERKDERDDRLTDLKEADIKAAIAAYIKAGGTRTGAIASRDLEVLQTETAELLKAQRDAVLKRADDETRRSAMSTIAATSPDVQEEAYKSVGGIRIPGTNYLDDARTFSPTTDELKKTPLDALERAASRSKAQQTLANELAKDKRDAEEAQAAATTLFNRQKELKGILAPQHPKPPVDYAGKLQHEKDLSKIPTRPSGTDIAKEKGVRELAKHHSLSRDIQKRFYSNVDIENANPVVLEAINEQVKAAQKEIDSINLSESGETAVYFGEVYIPQFRKLDREIKADAAAGKEIDQATLDLLRDKGNTLITFYSTHGRKAVPEDVDSLVGNAAKIPGAPVLRSITDAHDSAVLAEDIARDIVALKDAVGEDAMLKAVGKIDRPVAEIQKTLGLFVDSKQFQKIEKLIQKSQGLNNIVLKIRSGAAVTESEAARFLKEFADPSRQNYFTALQNFASNERNKSRMALKTQQDAGYVFNNNLVDAIGAEEAAPTPEEPSKYKGLSSEDARLYDKLKKTDPIDMNPRMKRLLELYRRKTGE